ncbi:MAG: hypothetical protein WD314_16390 [Trueperaceae bacterium]
MQVLAFQAGAWTTCRRRPAAERAWLIAATVVVAQMLWPLTAGVHGYQAPAFTPIGEAELAAVTGGCLSGCSGSDDSSTSSSSSPSRTGSSYWEFAYRSLISRPAVAGNLIWHRVNDTDRYWGPFDVTYTYREAFDWSLGGSVPQWFVQAHVGGEYETSRKLVERFTIPPRTYYKFFVAYPYERWRYYYRKYQDYSDNTRRIVASGDATVYDQWTKSTLVQGRVY